MLITLTAVFISEIKGSLVLMVFLVPEHQFNSTSTSFFSLLLKSQFILLQMGDCWLLNILRLWSGFSGGFHSERSLFLGLIAHVYWAVKRCCCLRAISCCSSLSVLLFEAEIAAQHLPLIS